MVEFGYRYGSYTPDDRVLLRVHDVVDEVDVEPVTPTVTTDVHPPLPPVAHDPHEVATVRPLFKVVAEAATFSCRALFEVVCAKPLDDGPHLVVRDLGH